MEIGIDDSGNLFVVDKSPYDRWIEEYQSDIDHVVYERVIEYSEDDEELNIVAENTVSATSIEELKANKTFDLPHDGLYHYQKIIVPTESHRGESKVFSDGTNLYFDDDNTIITIDFTAAFDYVNDVNTGNAFWFDDYVFSIYDLIKCYVLTEKRRLADWLRNNCKATCKNINNMGVDMEFITADMLMAAVMVLTYLISKRQFVEAYRILKGLQTCNGLCRDFVDDIRGCGCGKSV